MKYDLIVIGAGPGGYTAAIRASQLGFKTLCIDERDLPGGTCLHVGCIPSKALLYSSEMAHFFEKEASQFGISAEAISFNFDQMQKHSSEVVRSLAESVKALFERFGVDYIVGHGRLGGSKTVVVKEMRIEGERILLATGSSPIALPFLPFDEKTILTSTGALALEKVPSSLIVVGGGIIGLEMASIFARLGTKVSVIELLDEVAFSVDREMARALRISLSQLGIEFYLETRVLSGSCLENHVSLETSSGTFTAEKALICVGRKPNTDRLGLEESRVVLDKGGFIQIGDDFQTNENGVFALGDLVLGPMLAHKAEEEGTVFAERMKGYSSSVDLFSIPSVIYSFPEVASVGFSDKDPRLAGRELLVGKFPIKALGRAKAMALHEGLIKIVADKKSRHLLGMHLFTPAASEMILAGALALRHRMTIDQFKECSFAHPTLSEGIKEALFQML